MSKSAAPKTGVEDRRIAGTPEAPLGIAGDAIDYDALTLAEQSAGIGVWSIDLTTGLVRATAQFFRIMGLPPSSDPVPVETIRALRHPDDRERVVAGFRQALDGHIDTYEIEYRIVRPDGSLRWIFGRGRVVRDGSGKPIRYSGIDLDITDRKSVEAALAAAKEELERMNRELEARVQERTAQLRLEAEKRIDAESKLHHAQKMEAVGQLTGGVAHDFNNILQVIVGNLEIARIGLDRLGAKPDGETQAMVVRAIETMQRAAKSAKQLVHRLLAFSRRQELEPSELSINALIEDMSEMIERTLGETIETTTRLADDLWPTFADRNQLESALLNLVVNARDAMAEGGRLQIETKNITIRAHELDDAPPGDYVALAVSDTGCGIAHEHLDKVFEPFFTTKDTGKGSGLGLSMIYGFVKQSGGHLRIVSVVGSGTTVTIMLPRLDSKHARAPADTPAPRAARPLPQARPGETILLVEDNDEVRHLGVAALESLGYRVLQAGDGTSALRMLDNGAAERVDLLFTDVVLPGGMTGQALAAAANARRPELPVLFASGYASDTNKENLPDGELLDKPYSLDILAQRCRRAIDAAAASRPPSE
jgi:PAS domain S-box-containing protein